jgi:hypothetical protein
MQPTIDGDPTAALQSAIDRCSADGGGTVRVPPGDHEVGTLHLRDGVELELPVNATLRASPDLDDYDAVGGGAVLVGAVDAENVAVTGRGTIDGRARAFALDRPGDLDIPEHDARQDDYMDDLGDDADLAMGERPDGLCRFVRCAGLRIEGVTIQNSPSWTVHLVGCDRVRVTGVDIDNDLRIPNSDGIVPDMCRDVRVTDCRIRTGDDGIVLKTTGAAGVARPCEDVVVGDCQVTSRSCAVILGGETEHDIRHVVVSNVTIRDSNRGFGVRLLDAGDVRDVAVSNLTIQTRLFTGNWWGVGEPIYVIAHPRTPETDAGEVRNVRISNVVASGEQGAIVYGTPETPIRNLTVDGLDLRVRGGGNHDRVGGNFDLRWFGDSEGDLPTVYEREVPGLYATGAEDLSLRDCRVEWVDPEPYFSHGVECDAVTGLDVTALRGRGASEGRAALALRDCERVSVRDSVAAPGTDAFLDCRDVRDPRTFDGNDLVDAERPAAGENPFDL